MLHAMGVPSVTVDVGEVTVVVVSAEDAERARSELAKYERENEGAAPPEATPPISRGVAAAVAFGWLVALVAVLQLNGAFGFDWWSAGMADAGLIRHGAWWRAVTALCLHADLLHLTANVIFGALFGVMLAQSVGSGIAWLGFVLSGAVGNWLNAWAQSPSHRSIGASTAVFGILGIQVAYDWMQRGRLHYGRVRRWAPIFMGLVLLAWLGGGGGGGHIDTGDIPQALRNVGAVQRIDVGAHILGFGAGVGLGALLGLHKGPLRVSRFGQALLGGVAIALVALAWALALR